MGLKLLMAAGFMAVQPFSFRENWQRYPEPDSMIGILQGWYYSATLIDPHEKHGFCSSNDVETRRRLGANLPILGAPLTSDPGSSFVSWYMGCLLALSRADVRNIAKLHFAEMSVDIQARLLEYYPLHVLASPRDLDQTKWVDLSGVQKRLVAEHFVMLMIGPPSVVEGLGLGSQEGLVADLIQRADLFANREIDPLDETFRGAISVLRISQVLKYMLAMKDILRF